MILHRTFPGVPLSHVTNRWESGLPNSPVNTDKVPPTTYFIINSVSVHQAAFHRGKDSFSTLRACNQRRKMRLGSTIPDFTANSTHGPISLHKWIGNSWCMLFSHPADFTPVCTTELGRIAVHKKEFDRRNVKVLALSCDKLKDHTDWVNDIKSYCRDIPGDFPYPIVSDESRELAVLLDMLDEKDRQNPDTAMTVRALYIIDPNKKLRLSMVYPTSTGRNVDEILRVIDSLQLTDRLKVIATPANWVPGEKVMILPSVSEAEADKLFPNGIDRVSMPSEKNYVRTTTDYKM